MPVVFVRAWCPQCWDHRDAEVSREPLQTFVKEPAEQRHLHCLSCGYARRHWFYLDELALALAAPTWVSA